MPPSASTTDNHLCVCVCVFAGAYGVVVSAEDTRNGRKVAIKKVPNGEQQLWSGYIFCRCRNGVGCSLLANSDRDALGAFNSR